MRTLYCWVLSKEESSTILKVFCMTRPEIELCTHNYSRGTEHVEDLRKVFPRVLKEDQKERRCHDTREMVELINSDPAVLDALVTCDENWIYCYDRETKRQSSQWKNAGSPRTKKARQSKSTHKLLMVPFLTVLALSTCTGFPLDRQSTRNTKLREFR